MSQRLPAVFLAIAILAGTGSVGLAVYRAHRAAAFAHAPTPTTDVVVGAPSAATSQPSPSSSPSPTPAPTPLPSSLRINVPFTSQAPLGWNNSVHPEYEEWCEAAAIFMTGIYYRGDTREAVPGPEADQRIRQVVDYERKTFPGVLDLSLDKMGGVGAAIYNLDASIKPASPDSIRQELADGHPVIVPVMTHGLAGGRAIAPFYSAGNVYHVILIKGYDTQKGLFYTNDAGFTQGLNYAYNWDILSTAMDAQSARMGQGRMMLVFSPKA